MLTSVHDMIISHVKSQLLLFLGYLSKNLQNIKQVEIPTHVAEEILMVDSLLRDGKTFSLGLRLLGGCSCFSGCSPVSVDMGNTNCTQEVSNNSNQKIGVYEIERED